MLCVCLCLFVAMWSGLERERTLRSPQGAVDIRTVGLICGAGRLYHRERESRVWGYDAGAGNAGMHSRVWFGSNVSGLLRVERENLCCFHAFLNIIDLSHHTLGLRLRALLIIRQTHIVCT